MRLTVLAVAVLVYAPWPARNSLLLGQLTFGSSEATEWLWRGNNPNANGGSLTADDLETVHFGVGFRGYRMDEVDALLDRLSEEIAERDARISQLESGPPPQPVADHTADDAWQTRTDE